MTRDLSQLILEIVMYKTQVYFWTVNEWSMFLEYRKLYQDEINAFSHLDNYNTALKIRSSKLYKLLNEDENGN